MKDVEDEEKQTLDNSRLETEQFPWVGLTSVLLAHSSSLYQFNIWDDVLTMSRSPYLTKHKLNTQCTGYICYLLLNAGIRLPALKLKTESKDEHLQTDPGSDQKHH
ncbi:NBAS subunit of NRZ tethering complex-like [Carassius carassius]|uniref:NBAS subunit of NRZ tethering complex-like n=1 Tax=Carassius carassius TaxID=217509 RepID=UPI0028696BFA|nr:NBAS subunit of NRZ tethering complex-like [Carassius carassius]